MKQSSGAFVFTAVLALLAVSGGTMAADDKAQPAATPVPADGGKAAPSSPPPPPVEEKKKTLVSFPHPLVTEILYAVPTGEGGDANQDGTRDATGDEFVEVVNPHDKAINLRGYKIADKSLGKGNALSFTFPDCTLKPGEVAVVFNGCKANIPPPVGDSATSPKENPKFAGAKVFTMKATSTRQSFANAADAVVVYAPDGAVVEVVTWGKPEKMPKGELVEDAPVTTKGSVQRDGLMGKLGVHPPSEGGVSFSPGRFGSTMASAPAKDGKAPAADKPAKEKSSKDGQANKPADKKPAGGT